MNLAFSRRDRRVLVAGALIVSALLLASRGVPAWRGWLAASQSSASEMTAEVARIEAAIPLQRSLKDSLRARQARLTDLRATILPGDSPAASAAALASLLSSSATEAGVRLGSVQVRPDSAGENTFTLARVRADATGDIRGITRFLAALEGGTALLSVRELSVSAQAPGAPDTQAEALRVEIVVEGLAEYKGGGRREAGDARAKSTARVDSRSRGNDAGLE